MKNRSKLLAVMFVLVCCLGACGSKETMLLETEDIVREEYQTETVTGIESGKLAESVGTEPMEKEQAEEAPLFVHMCGAVKFPGVYELPAGSRVYDAVEAAGGFSEAACDSHVNMAQLLSDGCKIAIPTIQEIENLPAGSKWEDNGGDGSKVQEGLVNINTASKEILCTLPGIGESRAESILAYREENGSFKSVEEIMQIDGIKEGMFSKLKNQICVN